MATLDGRVEETACPPRGSNNQKAKPERKSLAIDKNNQEVPCDESPSTNIDSFGVSRGKCRCGRCPIFSRGLSGNEGRTCTTCSCPSNRHKRSSYFESPSPAKPVETLPECTSMPELVARKDKARTLPVQLVDTKNVEERPASVYGSSVPKAMKGVTKPSLSTFEANISELPRVVSPTVAHALPETKPSMISATDEDFHRKDAAPSPDVEDRKKSETAGLLKTEHLKQSNARREPSTAAEPMTREADTENFSSGESRREIKENATAQDGGQPLCSSANIKHKTTPPRESAHSPRQQHKHPSNSAINQEQQKTRKPTLPASSPSNNQDRKASSTNLEQPKIKVHLQQCKRKGKPVSIATSSKLDGSPTKSKQARRNQNTPTRATSKTPTWSSSTGPTIPKARRGASSTTTPSTSKKTARPKSAHPGARNHIEAVNRTSTTKPTRPSSAKPKDAEELKERKLRVEVETWRKEVRFSLYNKEYRRSAELCDTMLQRLLTLSESRKRWRLPILIERAYIFYKWALGSKSEAEKASRLKCAKLDCINVSEECLEDIDPVNKQLLALSNVCRGFLELASSNFESAKKHLAKGRDSLRKHSNGLLLLWGFDFELESKDSLEEATRLSKLLAQADESLRGHKPKSCLRYVDQLLQESPASARALTIKAEALLMIGKIDEASAHCSRVLSKIDKNAEKRLHTDLTVVHCQCIYLGGDVQRAIALLSEVDSTFIEATQRAKLTLWKRMRDLKSKGNAAFSRGDYDRAIKFYTECLSADRKNDKFNAVIYCNRAASHTSLGAFKLAVQDCDIALQLDPLYLKALLRRARAGAQCTNQGALHRARTDYQRIFRLEKSKLNECKKEFMELEIKIARLEKESRRRQQQQQQQQQRPQSAAHSRSRSTTDEKKKFKTWKEKQDENWKQWFKEKPKSTSYSSTKKQKARPSSSYSRRPSSASGGRSRGFFSSNNSSEWLNGRGGVKNFYKELGLAKSDGSRASIKKAFHKLALQYHPDKNQALSPKSREIKEVRFKAITEAYSVLGDDEKREQYDRFARCMGC